MSSAGGLVLSDVHLCKAKPLEDVIFVDDIALYRTDFRISCNSELLVKVRDRLDQPVYSLDKVTSLDDDGDIVLPRRPNPIDSINLEHGTLMLRIHHSMETQLSDVGMQVWMGALLMVDFILDKYERFSDKRVLELGGGAGIPSLIVGMVAKMVTVTDTGKSVLRLCEMNYQANRHLICCSEGGFMVQELDWFNSEKTDICYSYDCIIACDVIYDNDLTDAFFRALYKILNNTKPIPTVYISLEKRFNFTLAELDVTCKEYDHFRLCLNQLKETLNSIEIQEVDANAVSQHCVYDRTAQLELWTIYQSI